jgi:hypothetical protein
VLFRPLKDQNKGLGVEVSQGVLLLVIDGLFGCNAGVLIRDLNCLLLDIKSDLSISVEF